MSSPTTETIRWTIADLELFPDDGKRYEIIDGELLVTRAPHWRHQKLCVRVGAILDAWSQRLDWEKRQLLQELFFLKPIMLFLMLSGLARTFSFIA
jgi:Uma2 family endonuclease